MTYYVFSTLAAPMAYTCYFKNDVKELAIVEKTVLIKGGAGVMDARNIQTPRGVMTEITDAEYASLKDNKVFQIHLSGGFIIVEEKSGNADAIAKNMNEKDESRPITPDDFEKDERGIRKFKKGNKPL
jgi:hypothetical protein